MRTEQHGFDPARIRRWRRDVFRAFQREGLTPPEIQAAMVLAGVAAVGTDLSVLHKITGLSEDYVRKVLRRLRQQRVLKGHILRVAWDREESGGFAALLDGAVAAGRLTRPIDAKRSAAQKARKQSARRGSRPRTAKAPSGAVYTPKRQRSNPLYGLPEWEE